MASTASHRLRVLTAFLVAALLLVACEPGDRASPTSAATIAAAPTGEPAPTRSAPTQTSTEEPAPTDDGATAGGPAASATSEPAPTTSTTLRPPSTPASTSTPLPEVAEADPEPFAMNLFRKRDFVAQYTFEWCVGASLQMVLNMATDGSHTTRAEQQDLWEMARDRSDSPFGGANPRGWTTVLNDLGIGPYELVSLPTFDEAVTVAARAIRATNRPVGLVMWRGRHAWVMSGFESTGDPRTFDDIDVTGIRVHDPLYPHGSAVWGGSPKPNSLVSPETLARQFVRRDSRRVNLGVPPGYLLVLPVAGAA